MMPRIRPEDVVSPKDRWTLIAVLAQTNDWALALGRWKYEKGVEKNCLAIRWNGDATQPKGNPCSHGQPTWFVLPNDFDNDVLARVKDEKKRAMAKAVLESK
jgi:hypothetical protein